MKKDVVRVAGRKVLLATSDRSQTVYGSACAEVDGEYEHVVRITSLAEFVCPSDLERCGFMNVVDMVEYLKVAHGTKAERSRKAPYLRR
jgi:hypothetical protein